MGLEKYHTFVISLRLGQAQSHAFLMCFYLLIAPCVSSADRSTAPTGKMFQYVYLL